MVAPIVAAGAAHVARPLLVAAGRFIMSNAPKVIAAARPVVGNALKTAAPAAGNIAKAAVTKIDKLPAGALANPMNIVNGMMTKKGLMATAGLYAATKMFSGSDAPDNKNAQAEATKQGMGMMQKAVAIYHFCKCLGAGWNFVKDPQAFLQDPEKLSSAVHHIAAGMSLKNGGGIIMSELGGYAASGMAKGLAGAINNRQIDKALMFGALGAAATGLTATGNFNVQGVGNVIGSAFNKAKGLDMKDVFVGGLGASAFAYIGSQVLNHFKPGMMTEKAIADVVEAKHPHVLEASKQNVADAKLIEEAKLAGNALPSPEQIDASIEKAAQADAVAEKTAARDTAPSMSM